MAEVLVQFTEPVIGSEGEVYTARACGSEMPDGLWQGWIEFLPHGEGKPVRTGRETTQPSRADVLYWATGLTAVYLEGALDRALRPARRRAESIVPPPYFDGPAEDELPPVAPVQDAVLNPFSVYRKGEAILRNQLAALSPWHLVNIVRAHDLSDLDPLVLNGMSEVELIELIVAAVRATAEETNAR